MGVSCNIDHSSNAMIGAVVFTRDLLDWAAGIIKKLSGRVDPDHNRDLHLRRDERQRERERIARELHDTLLQGFLGVSLQLQAAVDQVPASSPSKAELDHAMVRMQNVINEARDILLGLRSSSTASMPLEHSFSRLRDELPAADGAARFRVFVTGQSKALKPAIQEEIYLIGREALINAFRHSEASSIEAEVQYLRRRLRVVVRDNGRGMDPKTLESGRHAHWGLLGMRERAAGVGAQLRIWSRPGRGTEVEIWIPTT